LLTADTANLSVEDGYFSRNGDKAVRAARQTSV